MRIRLVAAAAALAVVGMVGSAAAQATGMPSFNAPYRAFVHSEFGGTISFPNGGGTGLEGQYRFGYKVYDIGLRAGAFLPGGGANTVFLIGAEGRGRVITHTEQFPLDGAVILGAGGNFVSGASSFIFPAGLSLGRRLDIQGSKVSIVPYAQPTLFLLAGNGVTSHTKFSLGVGADFRLSRVMDARLSIGLGDVEGVSISAVWVH